MRLIAALVLMIITTFLFCQKKAPEEMQTPEKPYVWDGGNTHIGNPEWKIENSINPSDTDHVLRLELKEKYDGYHSLFCMAVFSNEKTRQYKLVAPWFEDVKFDWSLVTSKEALKVPYDSIPVEMKDVWEKINKMRENRIKVQ